MHTCIYMHIHTYIIGPMASPQNKRCLFFFVPFASGFFKKNPTRFSTNAVTIVSVTVVPVGGHFRTRF